MNTVGHEKSCGNVIFQRTQCCYHINKVIPWYFLLSSKAFDVLISGNFSFWSVYKQQQDS